jgi:O-succinylbenzoic acid--CoA ligase
VPAADRSRLVALDYPPGEQFAAELESAWTRGNAVLPLNPRSTAAERRGVVDEMRPDLPVEAGVALVITTSGSTGAPKGVQLTHAALQASAAATIERIGLEPGDRWLSCLPWHHIGGLQVLLRARQFGTPIAIHDTFDVRRVAAEQDVSLVSLVPTQLAKLLAADVDLRRFRAILLGGAAPPVSLLERAAEAGARVVTTYGMSETCGGCVYDGRPLTDVDVAIGADGRVRVRGPVVMSGYRLREDLTREALVDGWLVTNDLGRVEDGRLVVNGRADDVIITGGENVAATTVTDVLLQHPDVADVAVMGVDDDVWGQRIVAVVVQRSRPLRLDQLQVWCDSRLPAEALPRQLVVVADIPRLSSGKIDRMALRSLVVQNAGSAPPSGSSHSVQPPSSR